MSVSKIQYKVQQVKNKTKYNTRKRTNTFSQNIVNLNKEKRDSTLS